MPDAIIGALKEAVVATKESHTAGVASDDAYAAAQSIESWIEGAATVAQLPTGPLGSYEDVARMLRIVFILRLCENKHEAYKTLCYADCSPVEPGYFIAGFYTDAPPIARPVTMKLPLFWWQRVHCEIRTHDMPGSAMIGTASSDMEAIARMLLKGNITIEGWNMVSYPNLSQL